MFPCYHHPLTFVKMRAWRSRCIVAGFARDCHGRLRATSQWQAFSCHREESLTLVKGEWTTWRSRGTSTNIQWDCFAAARFKEYCVFFSTLRPVRNQRFLTRLAWATKQSRAKPATIPRDRPPLTTVKVRARDDKETLNLTIMIYFSKIDINTL